MYKIITSGKTTFYGDCLEENLEEKIAIFGSNLYSMQNLFNSLHLLLMSTADRA